MSSIPDNVIEYFAFNNGLPRNEVATIFDELEQFLISSSHSRQVPSKRLDEAWHAFILHTREYADYCSSQLGKFVHHVPDNTVSDDNLAKCHGCSSNCKSDTV